MIRETLCVAAAVCATVCLASAMATEVSGDQSGAWTVAGSPYEMVGDVRVPPGLKLIIEPGVEVVAKGHYRLSVDQGILQAVGRKDQMILFTAADHNAGWRGLRLLAADDRSELAFCIVEHAKGTGSYPDVRGGGVYIKDCSPTVMHCEMRFNYSHNSNYNGIGGGLATESSSALIVENFIHDNQADSGGGVCITEYGTPEVVGNTIISNTAYYAGGGMYFGARSSPLVEHNLILHNSAGGWGGGGINSWTSFIYYGTYATIRNNIISHNQSTSGGDAQGGGGVYCRYDRAIITGNTIADNTAATGGGIYALNYPDQAPIVTNTIVWANKASVDDQIHVYPGTGSAIAVTYSDVQGGWGGLGNMDAPPEFIDPARDDYHLDAISPCIDKADPGYIPVPGEGDIDGQRRIWDGDSNGSEIVDMGADEFGSYPTGDMNCDGVVDFGDINPFVRGLTDPAGYAAVFPDCSVMNADIDGNGKVDFGDINPFVRLLTQ